MHVLSLPRIAKEKCKCSGEKIRVMHRLSRTAAQHIAFRNSKAAVSKGSTSSRGKDDGSQGAKHAP